MKKKLDRHLIVLALLLLVALLAQFQGSDIPEEALRHLMSQKDAKITKISSSPAIYRLHNASSKKANTPMGYVVVGTGNGYGGPMRVATLYDESGEVQKVTILSHKDTPSFIDLVTTKNLPAAFKGVLVEKSATTALSVDAISGATYSSMGMAQAVSQASTALAVQLGRPVKKPSAAPWKISAKELWVAALLLAAMFAGITGKKRMRWPLLLSGLVILGFSFNAPLSVAQIARALFGYLPPFSENMAWYLMVVAMPLAIFITGKNIYCTFICPFGAVQELATKISGKNLSCGACVKKRARSLKVALLALALFMALFTKNPSSASYEPFATLFGLKGSLWQWVLLPAIVFSAFLFSRIWCRFFCPVSPVLDAVATWGRRLKSRIAKTEEP